MTLVCLRRFATLMLLSLTVGLAPAQSAPPPNPVTTWMAVPDGTGPALPVQTIRQIVRTSAGGTSIRIRLSNLHGAGPLSVGPVHVALRAAGATVQPGSDRALTFNGQPAVTIARGDSAWSDATGMDVPALRELAVSLYLPAGAAASTIHGAGMQTAYIVRGADASAAATLPATETDDSRYFLSDVEVSGGGGAQAIVIVGDSIVDGIGSTADSNVRWPDLLAARLAASATAVGNAGIAGNRILNDGAKPFVGPSALARFDRDALDKPGVRWVILQEGINDITASDMLAAPAQHASAQQIIDGMQALIQRAHQRGIRICGATLLPYGGVKRPFLHTADGEAKRQAVNAWIRDAGKFDAIADFDRLMRDPAHPDRLLPAFDSGDHLHPNDAGYRAMAESIAPIFARQP
jgi:lysophospholipase L1-like esterase